MNKLRISLVSFSVFAFLIPSIRHSCVIAANNSEALRLFSDVIDPYNSRIRPIVNQSKPIEVYVTFNLVNLIEMDEVNQRITLSMWVNYSWWDEIRTWNPDDYGGNDIIHPSPKDIWRPKTVLTNSAGERDVLKDVESPLSIYSTGSSRWYAGGIYYFVCSMDLTYFPFDRQTCTADVMSTDLGPEINFHPTVDIQLNSYVVNGEWDLKMTRVLTNKFPASEDENLTFLFVTVSFQRLPSFYLINILIPTMCLSFLSLFGFVVPKESGERASFAITVLLALAFYMGMVSSQLPATSDTFPLISIYIFCLLCLSMLSVLMIVCQLRMREYFFPKENEEILEFDQDKKENINTSNPLTENVFETTRINSSDRKTHPLSKSTPKTLHNQNLQDYDMKVNLPRNTEKNCNSPQEQSVSGGSNTRLLKRFKTIVLKYDDIVLMSVFTFIWAVFSIIFVSLIAKDT